jgi:hypothetical protein
VGGPAPQALEYQLVGPLLTIAFDRAWTLGGVDRSGRSPTRRPTWASMRSSPSARRSKLMAGACCITPRPVRCLMDSD